MKNTLLACLALATLMLSGCVVGVGTTPVSYTSPYAGPSLVVIPGTYVYVAPDIGADIYFHVGYWWRLSDGFWYRSHHYDRGWSRYRGIPVFYRQIDPGWRTYYAQRKWRGHPWKCERIPAHRVQREWSRWEATRHWEKQNNWGVQGWRATAHRQHIDAPPPARTALRQPDRHQDYRTDRVRRENATSTPQRSPQTSRPQKDRQWQASPDRQSRQETTQRSPQTSRPQEDRQWQASPDRQSRQETTQPSPQTSRPQEDRQWQASPDRQSRQETTQPSPQASRPQKDRQWQASPDRQSRQETTQRSPQTSRPQEDRRHRQDGGGSSTVLQQSDPQYETTQEARPLSTRRAVR